MAQTIGDNSIENIVKNKTTFCKSVLSPLPHLVLNGRRQKVPAISNIEQGRDGRCLVVVVY